MKYSNLIISALLGWLGMSAATAHPLYIYSSTNGVIALDTENIVSIDYVEATEETPAVQNFVTEDNVYSIPVDEIDYVGFETPENEFVSGVNQTATLSDYVVSANQLTLFVQKSTPSEIIPSIGQTIFVEADGEKLTIPFAGKVNALIEDAERLIIECDPVELTDIFETYYGVIGDGDTPAPQSTKALGRASHSGSGTFTPAPSKFDLTKGLLDFTYDGDSPLSIGRECGWDVTVAPSFHYNGYVVVQRGYGVNLGVGIITDISITNEIRVAGTIGLGNDLKLWGQTIPIPEALIDIYIEVGLAANASCTAAVKHTLVNNYRHSFRFDWSSRNKRELRPVCDFRKTGESYEGEFTVSGSVSAGVYVELGVAFICTSSLDIAKADVRFETGLEAKGNWVPSKRDAADALTSPDYYRRVSQAKIEKGTYKSGAAEFHLFGWSKSYDQTIFEMFNGFEPFEQMDFVPSFSDTYAERSGNTAVSARTMAYGNTVPCDLGVALIDKKDKSVKKVYYHSDYEGPSSSVSTYFTGLDSKGNYTVRPLVKTMGVEMVAEPSYDLDEIPIFGKYTCVWNTTPPNAKLLSMSLNEDYTMSQTYYYANRNENVTYSCTFSWDDDILTMYKDNGDVQKWHIDELTENTLVIRQSDGFTYHLVR